MLTLPAQEATTAHLCSAYPFQAGLGLGTTGLVVGLDAHSGAVVRFDPFDSYATGALTSPAILVLGRVGRGKSSFVKSLLYRQVSLRGRRAFVLDPKGEYAGLAELAGLAHLSLRPAGSARLNPLDPSPAGETGRELAARRAGMLVALAGCDLGRDLSAEERAVIGEVAAELGSAAVLSDVVSALLAPSRTVADRLAATPGDVAARVREVAMNLRRLVAGELAGILDGPTTVELDWRGPGLVLDLSALFDSPALASVMVAAASWLSVALRLPGPCFLVLDEAWALLAELSVARWLQATNKLARSTGTSLVLVTHRLSDLEAGAAGSETERLATGLLADAEVRVVFGQAPGERPRAASLLGLSSEAAELLTGLARGEALWQVGDRVALVRHLLSAHERRICDTDAAMRAADSECAGSSASTASDPGGAAS